MTAPSTMSDEPPPYPGFSSAFGLPPYETVTALDYWDDSYCLPPYQSRTGQRYHPYMRILPVHRGYIPRQEMSFGEFYRSLQASVNRRAAASPSIAEAPSAATRPVPLRPPAQALTNHQAPPPIVETPAAPGPPQHPGQNPAERRRRLIRRLFLLPEILKIVRAGLGTAMRAVEARF